MTPALAPVALEAALAAVPDRRDFSFSPDLGRAAWIDDDVLEWIDDGEPGRLLRVDPNVALPPGTHVEHVSPVCIGVCRPTDAGVEILALEASGVAGAKSNGHATGWSVRRVRSLVTPRACLLPRLPGAAWQFLAVAGFEGASTLWRVDWDSRRMEEAGRLPAPVDGGLWLDAGRRLAVNLRGPSRRTSVHLVDVEAGNYHRLFEVSPETDDRVVRFDEATGTLVVTTDAFGYPAVGLARLGQPDGVRFLPPLSGGEEAGEPCAFVRIPGTPRTPGNGGRALLLRHEDGVYTRLRLANTETLEVSAPLPLPDGEIGRPVVSDGHLVRFPFSAPDLPWRTATFDLEAGRFRLDQLPGDEAGDAPSRQPALARATSFAGPAGPMPALVHAPVADAGDFVVVALHGGPIARWSAEYTGDFQLFSRLGLPVVALNYPGSTGSGQRFMRALFGRAGSLDVEAVASVVDALSRGRDVILYGESYGAFLALATAAVRPTAGVIAYAPFASFARLRASGSPEVRDVLELLDGGNPLEFGRNLVKGCRTIRGKVLIAHGTADRTIPVDESRELARALREGDGAGEDDVRFVELTGQGHELGGHSALEQWYREVARFVASVRESRSPAQREHQQGR